jgi:hypothetical protein
MRRRLALSVAAVFLAVAVPHAFAGAQASTGSAARTPTPTPTQTPDPTEPHDPPVGGIGGGGTGGGGGGGGGNPPATIVSARWLTAAWRGGGTAVAGRVHGAAECIANARVVLERRRDGRVRRLASARTTSTGGYRIHAARHLGRYRVRAPAVQRLSAGGPVDCRAASHVVG